MYQLLMKLIGKYDDILASLKPMSAEWIKEHQ